MPASCKMQPPRRSRPTRDASTPSTSSCPEERRMRKLVACGVLLAAAVGCATTPAKPPDSAPNTTCSSDSYCAAGSCSAGQCSTPYPESCAADSQCSGGSCRDGHCSPLPPEGAACRFDLDCRGGTCVSGHCSELLNSGL